MKITAIILTKNEEKNILKALESVKFCDEIIVLDDFSTDGTLPLLRRANVRLIQKPLENDFSKQRNSGLKEADGNWILFLDADEEVTIELQREIVKKLMDDPEVSAFYIRRRDYFWGKELKHGELRKTYQKGIIRLMKKESGTWEGTVHEEFKTDKAVGYMSGFINHYPHKTIKEFLHKVNLYSTLRANELYKTKKNVSTWEFVVYPFGKFFYTYILSAGFLDGAAGFVYSFLMSFHSFLVRAKLFQLNEKIA